MLHVYVYRCLHVFVYTYLCLQNVHTSFMHTVAPYSDQRCGVCAFTDVYMFMFSDVYMFMFTDVYVYRCTLVYVYMFVFTECTHILHADGSTLLRPGCGVGGCLCLHMFMFIYLCLQNVHTAFMCTVVPYLHQAAVWVDMFIVYMFMFLVYMFMFLFYMFMFTDVYVYCVHVLHAHSSTLL